MRKGKRQAERGSEAADRGLLVEWVCRDLLRAAPCRAAERRRTDRIIEGMTDRELALAVR